MEAVPTRKRPAGLRMAGLPLAAVAVLALPLAACSSSGSSSDPSSTPAAAGSSSGASQTGLAAFVQCVRSHGVPEMPDPKNGHFIMNSAIQNNPNLQSALAACQNLLGPGGLSGGSNNSTARLNFAHCMQTHGVPQFPDPDPDGAINVPSSIDQNSPQFQNAQQECQSDLQGQ